MTRVFVLNAGSSSLKYEVVDVEAGTAVTSGLIERVTDYSAALADVLGDLESETIDAVGHRIVHGGSVFAEATLIDDSVEQEIDRLATLAPLHNPPGLEGIRAARAALPLTIV